MGTATETSCYGCHKVKCFMIPASIIHAYGPLHGGQGLVYIAVHGVALTYAENRRSIRHAGCRARLQRLFCQLASLALGHVQGGQHRGQARQCRWVDDPARTKD